MIAWVFNDFSLVITGLAVLHLLGVVHSLHVLKHVRSSQGAIAWIGGLLILPILLVPMYWLSGRTRYHNYLEARKQLYEELSEVYDELEKASESYSYEVENTIIEAISKISHTHSTEGNNLKLLKDADEKFSMVFEELKSARDYVLVEYFTIKDDDIGGKLKDALIECSERDVRVYLLFDSFGSSGLSKSYLNDLKDAGVDVGSFGVKRKWLSRFQLNFRNHRKIIVIDGVKAFVGGINVGDEYLGREELGYWRDTHLFIEGPAVLGLQMLFIEDYYWGNRKIIDVNWVADFTQDEIETGNELERVTSLSSNPSDDFDTWHLTVALAASVANERLWITSPYLVPDGGVITALKTAVMRGVDVRILYPEKSDQFLAGHATYAFQKDLVPIGVGLYEYNKGFIHQKVIIVDSEIAMVGSANLDNRSFRLNFEVMMLSESDGFIKRVGEILENDFTNSTKVDANMLSERSAWVEVLANIARLFAPIL